MQSLNAQRAMALLVSSQQGLWNKCFPTHVTLVRSLPRMIAAVHHQSGALCEWLDTTVRGVWLLTSVCALMNFQGCLHIKCLATYITNQVLLLSVNPEMYHQRPPAWQRLPTNINTKLFPPVCILTCRASELLWAKVLSQISHWCFFSGINSGLCVNLCSLKMRMVGHDWPQTSHIYLFLRWCMSVWFCSSAFVWKPLSHTSHLTL